MAIIDNLTNSSLINDARKMGSTPITSLSGLSSNVSSSTIGSNGVSTGQYGFEKYDIRSLTYPIDLLGNDQSLSSKNYVIFYINVSVDSRVLKGKGKQEVVTGVTRDLRSDLVGQKITAKQAQVAALVSGGPIEAFATAILSPSTGDAVPGEAKEAEFTRPQKRLKKAIALYVPNRLEANYSVNYTEEETASFQAYAKGASEIGNMLKNRDMASVKQSSGVAGDVLSAFALGKADKTIGIGAGKAVNPKKEQAFTGVNFRTFTFNYTFAPRSEAEAEIVKNIIYEFKYHMHPEFLNPSAFTYVYPSEFDIVYYNGPNENKNLHKHTSCVLESMSVDYTPNTLFSTFDNGMPTQINLTLTFKELLAASKETIERGL
jgi:hypothetical protein